MTDKKAWVPDSESNNVANDDTSHNSTSSSSSTVVAAVVDLEYKVSSYNIYSFYSC
jgi:hypothetical protein